ncbi:3'-5' exonuclease [Konateibacter massiliensis]|uniref:3'-5' exonuclease n=1 Tax=Konateibacter massiliensis TaxID=2002841 RepID=UPI000C14FCF9|nr:3'-5' exonuclease [Konateibacter massiliensis]
MINSYIALDLETTGLNPKFARIIEIGAARIQDGKIVETYGKIVNAKTDLPQNIISLTGITQEMMEAGEALETVLAEFMDFCGDDILLGHNIPFDYSFMKKAAVNHAYPFERKGIDTLKLARRFLPELEKRSLESLCEYYQIEQTNKHRAYYDAIAASEVYQILLKQFYSGNEGAFEPFQLNYEVKRESPITARQKIYLNDLIKYHKISLTVQLDSLTKNEASRIIDGIILQHGRIS